MFQKKKKKKNSCKKVDFTKIKIVINLLNCTVPWFQKKEHVQLSLNLQYWCKESWFHIKNFCQIEFTEKMIFFPWTCKIDESTNKQIMQKKWFHEILLQVSVKAYSFVSLTQIMLHLCLWLCLCLCLWHQEKCNFSLCFSCLCLCHCLCLCKQK